MANQWPEQVADGSVAFTAFHELEKLKKVSILLWDSPQWCLLGVRATGDGANNVSKCRMSVGNFNKQRGNVHISKSVVTRVIPSRADSCRWSRSECRRKQGLQWTCRRISRQQRNLCSWERGRNCRRGECVWCALRGGNGACTRLRKIMINNSRTKGKREL